MEIKDILRDRRQELGLTMREVADACGVSEATVSRWESGDIANMRRNKISALAAVLKLSPAVIMGWEEPPRYYLDDETAKAAQEAFDNPDIKMLLDAARGSRSEDIRMVAGMLLRFKETNPDG